MTTTISGTNGIDKIAAGAIEKADLPAGTVLQVVNATCNVQTGTSSSTYSDTGLSASITPTSSTSKILITACQNGNLISSAITAGRFILIRNGTQLAFIEDLNSFNGDGNVQGGGSSVITYLDSPSTTSSLTYKTQFSSRSNAGVVQIQYDNCVSTITLMEIAA